MRVGARRVSAGRERGEDKLFLEKGGRNSDQFVWLGGENGVFNHVIRCFLAKRQAERC